MIEAAKLGDIKKLKEQLKQGRAPDLKDGSGLTALHYAVRRGHLNCVNYLLKSCLDEYNLTRIQASKSFTHMGTPLILACRDDNVSIAIIKALIRADPGSVNICMPAGGNALHVACRSERPAVVRLLLASGADVNARSNTGLRPLHTAAQSNDLSCLKILLEAGADTALCNLSGCTPLFSSVLDEYLSCADELLNYMRPDGINITTRMGYTVLMKVAEFEYKHLIEKLLLKGADPHMQTVEGRFAVDFAKNAECAKVLLKAMDRSRLKKLKTRDFPYSLIQKRIVKLMCEMVPELFSLQVVEYVFHHWAKAPQHCLDMIGILFKKLQPRTRMRKLALNTRCSIFEVIDAYLSVCKQDIILYWRESDLVETRTALPVILDKHVSLDINFFVLLASNNPRYSPAYIINRERDSRDFKYKMSDINIPDSWEVKYDAENDEYVKPVQSLKQISRTCIRDTFRKNGVVSCKDFRNGVDELGLPKLLKFYIRYLADV